MHIYHYFFYKFYSYMLTTPNFYLATNGAVIYLSIMTFGYLLTLNIFFELYWKLYKIPNPYFEILMFVLALIIYVLNYKYFKRPEIKDKIIERFSIETNKSKTIGNLFVLCVFLGSFISFMLSGYLINKNR